MEQPRMPQGELRTWLDRHPVCRWPIWTAILTPIVGFTAAACGNVLPAQAFGVHLASIEKKRAARPDAAALTQWHRANVQICHQRWSFVVFPSPDAAATVDPDTMAFFFVCFDDVCNNHVHGPPLVRSIVRGSAAELEDTASVDKLVANFKFHPAAASVFSVFDDVSDGDVAALASGLPPPQPLRHLLLRCLKTMAEEGALAITGVAPAYRPAAAQPVVAVAAVAAAASEPAPAPPPAPAAPAARAPVPASPPRAAAVVSPTAAEQLQRIGSRGGSSDTTRKRRANILDSETARNLRAASGGDEAVAAELAAQMCDGRQVRAVVGDKLDELRRKNSLSSFKAALARHGQQYHLAVKANQPEHAGSVLSSIVDINDNANVSAAHRLNTAALAELLSLAEHPLAVGDAVFIQDGPRRPAFKVERVNDDGTFDLREKDGERVRSGVARAEAIHATDIRVTPYLIKTARLHARDAGPGQLGVIGKQSQ